jgi:hypothetical protein
MIGFPIVIDVHKAMIQMLNQWMNQDSDVARVPGSMFVNWIRTVQSWLLLASGVGQGQQQKGGSSSNCDIYDRKDPTNVSFVTAKICQSRNADSAGKLIYTGAMSNKTFQAHGKGKMEYIEKDTVSWYECYWRDGEMMGNGVSRHVDGSYFTGEFCRAQMIQGK